MGDGRVVWQKFEGGMRESAVVFTATTHNFGTYNTLPLPHNIMQEDSPMEQLGFWNQWVNVVFTNKRVGLHARKMEGDQREVVIMQSPVLNSTSRCSRWYVCCNCMYTILASMHVHNTSFHSLAIHLNNSRVNYIHSDIFSIKIEKLVQVYEALVGHTCVVKFPLCCTASNEVLVLRFVSVVEYSTRAAALFNTLWSNF